MPKEFRFEGDSVRIRREGNKVILEPVEKSGWPPGFWERFDKLPPVSDEFEAAVREPFPPDSPYREQVIEDYVRWANEQHAARIAESAGDSSNGDDRDRPSES